MRDKQFRVKKNANTGTSSNAWHRIASSVENSFGQTKEAAFVSLQQRNPKRVRELEEQSSSPSSFTHSNSADVTDRVRELPTGLSTVDKSIRQLFGDQDLAVIDIVSDGDCSVVAFMAATDRVTIKEMSECTAEQLEAKIVPIRVKIAQHLESWGAKKFVDIIPLDLRVHYYVKRWDSESGVKIPVKRGAGQREIGETS